MRPMALWNTPKIGDIGGRKLETQWEAQWKGQKNSVTQRHDQLAKEKEPREPHLQTRSWSSFFDKKENHVNKTKIKLIMMP